MNKRPNFLFIMTDQHRADWLGCSGHPVVKTPNIDALAERGTRFENFYVASPVCMPNRASFMTGRYPSTHGLRYNGCLLSERANTFVGALKDSGYKTALIGKSHLQPFTKMFVSQDANAPTQEAWKADIGDYKKEEPDRYTGKNKYDFPVPYYGFDHVDMVTGHGDAAGGHYGQWFKSSHPDWETLQAPSSRLPHNYSVKQANRTPIAEEDYPTAWIKDRAIEYLRAHAHSDQPLFTYVSFPDPHHPFNPPGRYWYMYDPDDFETGPSYEDHKNPPSPLSNAREDYENGVVPDLQTTVFMANDREVREAMSLTAGMITMIDDAVGEIIQALKETGRYDNTIIVFNADHGDYLGDCNLLLKGAWSRDSINRVPMIWADPTSDNQADVSSVLASTVDLSSTILDRAGVAPYFGMQGRSLLDCLTGTDALRDSLLVEYNDGLPRMGFALPARVRTLVTPDWQLAVYRGENWGELYDRKTDPQMLNNLWDDPEHADTKANLVLELTQHLIAQMDESPRHTRVA